MTAIALRSTCGLLDQRVRTRARIATYRARERASLLSDALLGGALVDSILIDGIAIPRAHHDRRGGWKRALAEGLALGITYGIGHVIKDRVRRPRPFEWDPALDRTLPRRERPPHFASFYSVHTAMAFTSAGFATTMHLASRGGPASFAHGAACGAALALATATGLLRIVSDRHYLSDVLVGAAMGMAVGATVPIVLLGVRPRR